MPIRRGEDSKGPYYQYGDSGAKYHYQLGDKSSRERAKSKAQKQSAAIKSNK